MSTNNKSNDADKMVEEADLEQLAKSGKPVPPAKRYRIRIDDKHYTVEKQFIIGRELLGLAGKNPPENFILTQKTRGGGVKTIGLDDKVDLREPGIERFNTLPRQVQEG